VATEHGIIQKSGSWYGFDGERVQGREGLKKLLVESPEMARKLEVQTLEKLNIPMHD
jgi:recombination protein RecA